MTHTTSARRRMAQGLAIATLAAITLTGVVAGPASAATSKTYSTKTACLNAQRMYSGSFTRITKSCYWVNPSYNGVYLDVAVWRFEYASRT